MKRLCPVHGLWNKTDDKQRCPTCKAQRTKEYDKNHRNKKSKKVYDTKQWREDIRPGVLIRDMLKCVKCGSAEKSKDLVVDHIVELSDGGDKYNKDNLQTLCRSCHKKKTDIEKERRTSEIS